jgi:hypothetical protein
VRADRMAQNIDVFDFELTGEQMARIAAWTPARRCSSTTATRPWSADSAASGSTTEAHALAALTGEPHPLDQNPVLSA